MENVTTAHDISMKFPSGQLSPLMLIDAFCCGTHHPWLRLLQPMKEGVKARD